MRVERLCEVVWQADKNPIITVYLFRYLVCVYIYTCVLSIIFNEELVFKSELVAHAMSRNNQEKMQLYTQYSQQQLAILFN